MNMPFVIEKGKTVLVPSGSGLHLFIIITNICVNQKHLLVPICSIREGKFYDPTCILKATDAPHPFIKNDSYVSYREIQERFADQITKCVVGKSFIQREDFDPEVLERVCAGIEVSPHIPKWAKLQYKDWPK